MARVQAIGFQVNQIIKEVNGIRESKKENRANSPKIAENGHKVSTKVHSFKSIKNLRNDLTNLGHFAKHTHKVKEFKYIDIKIVKDWLRSKEITYRTASNYLSELNKVSDYLNITKEEIKELRTELKEQLPKTTSLGKDSRAYSAKILNKVQLEPKFQIAFKLQKDYGLRLKEATHINLNRQLKSQNELQIQGKGGKLINIKVDNQLIKEIKKYANEKNIYSVSPRTYAYKLQKEIERVGGEWKGTHGLRHSFAQSKLEEGYTKKEVSQAMGHNREEITNTYLR